MGHPSRKRTRDPDHSGARDRSSGGLRRRSTRRRWSRWWWRSWRWREVPWRRRGAAVAAGCPRRWRMPHGGGGVAGRGRPSGGGGFAGGGGLSRSPAVSSPRPGSAAGVRRWRGTAAWEPSRQAFRVASVDPELVLEPAVLRRCPSGPGLGNRPGIDNRPGMGNRPGIGNSPASTTGLAWATDLASTTGRAWAIDLASTTDPASTTGLAWATDLVSTTDLASTTGRDGQPTWHRQPTRHRQPARHR